MVACLLHHLCIPTLPHRHTPPLPTTSATHCLRCPHRFLTYFHTTTLAHSTNTATARRACHTTAHTTCHTHPPPTPTPTCLLARFAARLRAPPLPARHTADATLHARTRVCCVRGARTHARTHTCRVHLTPHYTHTLPLGITYTHLPLPTYPHLPTHITPRPSHTYHTHLATVTTPSHTPYITFGYFTIHTHWLPPLHFGLLVTPHPTTPHICLPHPLHTPTLPHTYTHTPPPHTLCHS